MQCIVIGPVCEFVCVFVGLFVSGSVSTITRISCIDLHQTGFLGEGSDRLQMIKFWPSCAPGKGSAAGRNFLAPPASCVCVNLNYYYYNRPPYESLLLCGVYQIVRSRNLLPNPHIVLKLVVGRFKCASVLYSQYIL